MSGGPGYVLSAPAVRQLVAVALGNGSLCSDKDEGIEDMELGICLGNAGVEVGQWRPLESIRN